MRRLIACTLVLACESAAPPLSALPPNAFAFGVFGDGPYTRQEVGRFRQVLGDANAANIVWLLHVGDMIGVPCSDELLAERRAEFAAMDAAVVYTPGDNEWTDCGRRDSGGYRPLERLAHIRATFFSDPHRSMGRSPLALEAQSDSVAWREFVENARWRFGGFLFVTLHVVGSANGRPRAGGDSLAREAEVDRRTLAALHWLDAAFAEARSASLRGVVVAMHADPGFQDPTGALPAYSALVRSLATHVSEFQGEVLLIHGDSHIFRVDHPLRRPDTAAVLANFTRLETYGSPQIGWVRVVVDSVAGRILSYEPRLMPQRLW